MPLTATATMVHMPASASTGSGRLDPEPWPRSGEVSMSRQATNRLRPSLGLMTNHDP